MYIEKELAAAVTYLNLFKIDIILKRAVNTAKSKSLGQKENKRHCKTCIIIASREVRESNEAAMLVRTGKPIK